MGVAGGVGSPQATGLRSNSLLIRENAANFGKKMTKTDCREPETLWYSAGFRENSLRKGAGIFLHRTGTHQSGLGIFQPRSGASRYGSVYNAAWFENGQGRWVSVSITDDDLLHLKTGGGYAL